MDSHLISPAPSLFPSSPGLTRPLSTCGQVGDEDAPGLVIELSEAKDATAVSLMYYYSVLETSGVAGFFLQGPAPSMFFDGVARRWHEDMIGRGYESRTGSSMYVEPSAEAAAAAGNKVFVQVSGDLDEEAKIKSLTSGKAKEMV